MCRVIYKLLNHYHHVLFLVLVQQGHLVYGGDFLDPYDELLVLDPALGVILTRAVYIPE